jgi:ubiquinol-cytochrome c reductase cytochrome c1 subunit
MEMKKLILTAFAALVPSFTLAAGGADVPLEKFVPDVDNQASLQRGAGLFMNYCSGCHSTRYARHERTADDIGIPHDLYLENLVFDPSFKIGNLMTNAMAPEKGKAWFGALPPDLTMVTRVRGGDWVYSYLKSFYTDPSRPWGVNNLVFKDVGMPNVLAGLQGEQKLMCKNVPVVRNGKVVIDNISGKPYMEEACNQLGVVENSGSMNEAEFDQAVYDITNYLSYVAEPAQLERRRVGPWVLGFLVILFIFTYLLKKEYWRDVH